MWVKHRDMLMDKTGFKPIKCPKCRKEMNYCELIDGNDMITSGTVLL